MYKFKHVLLKYITSIFAGANFSSVVSIFLIIVLIFSGGMHNKLLFGYYYRYCEIERLVEIRNPMYVFSKEININIMSFKFKSTKSNNLACR